MKPQIRDVAEKADGTFMFTAEDLDQPGVLYGYDNVRLVQHQTSGEIYIEHDFVASTEKGSTIPENEIRRNGEILLHKIWETLNHE